VSDVIPIADAHEDVAWDCLKSDRDFTEAQPGKALTLPNWEAGNVRLVCSTVFSADEGSAVAAAAQAERQCNWYDALCDAHPERVARATVKRDLDADALAAGPVRTVHIIEGADMVSNPDDLRRWNGRGVVSVGPVWNSPNKYGAGIDASRGLTPDGFALVRMAAMHGMAVDLSHLNRTAFGEAIESAMGPVWASHSNAHAICAHRRNLEDAQLKQIADHGGIVGVVFYAPFIQPGATGPAPIEGLCRHIQHIGRLIGFERVCLGTDFDGGFDHTSGVEGIPTAAELPRLADELRKRRYTEETIRGILGDNLRRFIQSLLPDG
jgi:membrane dipeptidase